jgi:uncharacterized membrane protein YfcA
LSGAIGAGTVAPMSAALVIALTFLLAGLVKGVIGLGLPTVAVGLLTLVMPPAQAAALLVVPSLVTNVWQLLAGPRFGGLLRRLSGMMLGICVGTAAGAGWLTGGDTARATALLGIALMLYAAAGLAALRLTVPPRAERFLSPLVGATTGLVSAATGVFVLPAAPYLQALGLDREDLVQALGLSFTVSTVALACVLARDGALPLSIAGSSLLALAPALAGMLLGQWLRVRASPRVFRICFFLGLLALGGHLALRAVL